MLNGNGDLVHINGGEWQRRLANGQVTAGSKSIPWAGIPKEKPGKGNYLVLNKK